MSGQGLLIGGFIGWAIVCFVAMAIWSLLSDPTEEWLSPAEQYTAYAIALGAGWVPLGAFAVLRHRGES